MGTTTKLSPLLQANRINEGERAVAGTVRRLTFRNEQNGYFVAQLQISGLDKDCCVVGYAPAIHVGERLEAKGQWTQSKYGTQFKAKKVTLSAPLDELGLTKFLAGALKGIGPGYAAKLVAAFGTRVGDIITDHPERLTDVPGIGPKRAQSIVEAWEVRRGDATLLSWLCSLGLSMTMAERLKAKYGGRARRQISENPYRLASEFRGIGFKRADGIARRLGILPTNAFRIQAALRHVISTASDSGSCGLPRAALIEKARELLGFKNEERSTSLISDQLTELVNEKFLSEDVARGESCIFLATIHTAEKLIAQKLHSLLNQPFTPEQDLDTKIEAAECYLRIALEDAQRMAVRLALSKRVCVITGGPGTGKTTITRVIAAILQNAHKTLFACAPTGKAAKRLAEVVQIDARTVHRMLEWKPSGPQYNEHRRLPCDVAICDEWSMADVPLFQALLAALPDEAQLIIIGDADQLPSVGPGKVLTDLIDSGVVPSARLTEVFRQARDSHIIRFAHAVNEGNEHRLRRLLSEAQIKCPSDFEFFEHESAQDAATALVEGARMLWKRGFHPIREVQVLAPMRTGGALGVDSLNAELQRKLNPTPKAQMSFQRGMIGVDDKVIQLRNNYAKEVFNGELGYVLAVDPEKREIDVDFDGRTLTYRANELDELRLAYAFSIHRSQGSEFPAVLLAFDWCHFIMLKRNLLYTGVTRGRQLVQLYGSIEAVKKAAENCQIEERYSKLHDWLVKK